MYAVCENISVVSVRYFETILSCTGECVTRSSVNKLFLTGIVSIIVRIAFVGVGYVVVTDVVLSAIGRIWKCTVSHADKTVFGGALQRGCILTGTGSVVIVWSCRVAAEQNVFTPLEHVLTWLQLAQENSLCSLSPLEISSTTLYPCAPI